MFATRITEFATYHNRVRYLYLYLYLVGAFTRHNFRRKPCWRTPIRTKQLSTVAILLYRFLSCCDVMSREWEDKRTCPLYIAFCSGLGRQHTSMVSRNVFPVVSALQTIVYSLKPTDETIRCYFPCSSGFSAFLVLASLLCTIYRFRETSVLFSQLSDATVGLIVPFLACFSWDAVL